MRVPTWLYGHEPSTPLATHIAKYFQNSIREEGLLAIGQQGVVFTEGSAGTIHEIFQDAAQNYYKTFGYFSPMVFLGVDYWGTRFPVRQILSALLKKEEFSRLVLFTDDYEAAHDFILNFRPPEPRSSGFAALHDPARIT